MPSNVDAESESSSSDDGASESSGKKVIELHNDYDGDSSDEKSLDEDSLDTWSQKRGESSINALDGDLDLDTNPKDAEPLYGITCGKYDTLKEDVELF